MALSGFWEMQRQAVELDHIRCSQWSKWTARGGERTHSNWII